MISILFPWVTFMRQDAWERDEDMDLSEIARISNLATKIRRFLEYIESVYLFLGFMLGIIAISQFFIGLGDILGMPQDVLASVGSMLGIIVSAAVYFVYAKKIFRFTGNKYMSLFSNIKEIILYNLLVFLSWIIIVLLVEYVNPGAQNVVWHPGLTVTLITIYLAKRSHILTPHFIAALIMLPFTPLVVMEASQKLALGSMLVAYYIAGVYSLREALKVFEEA